MSRQQTVKAPKPLYSMKVEARYVFKPTFQDRLALLFAFRKNIAIDMTLFTQWKVGNFSPSFKASLTDEQIPKDAPK
jgi:hypothetical protein